jgi:PAS domain S-box-containing protein
MEKFLKNKSVTIGFIILSTIIIFLLDLSLRLGIIIWILYLIPIASGHLMLNERNNFLLIGFYSVLMVIASIFSPPGIPVEYAIFNRTMGVVVFLFIHYLLSHYKKTQKSLDEINKRFNLAVESANTGVWDYDIKNNLIIWDKIMLRIYGIDKNSYNQSFDSWKNVIDPIDSERTVKVFQKAIEGSGDYQDVYSIIRGDGEKRYIRTYGRIEKDNEGRAIKAVGINIDITDQKKAEDTLLNLNDELSRSNKELENFAYIASHDLQEPLRMISSFSQLLEKKYSDKLDQEAHEFIKFVVDGANHMQLLINDLLEYSRITTQVGICKTIDANIPVKRAIDNLQLKIENCNAVVKVSDLPVVSGDELHLIRLFQNLIDNALKFTGTGNPTIEINCKPDFNAWLFSVKDDGIGIDPKNQEKIFEIFQRLNSRDKYPGTGIGLAICKRIVEQHGGKLWLESEPGKGTTFFFTIKK